MDESFQLRARRLLGRQQAARLDYSMLTASLAAQAAATAAAQAQARAEAHASGPAEPLGEIVLAGAGWREAAGAQRGCFNRTAVRRRLNLP
jgi:hypothetical protein